MGITNWIKNIGKNTAYYPGCLTKYVLTGEMESYKRILSKLGIDFITIPEEMCCGSPAINAGYEKDARVLARKNLEIFKKYNVKRIITNCPACFKVLGRDYKEFMPDWDMEVDYILKVILKKIKSNPKLIENKFHEKITYHDPCHLGRASGIYEEPREILRLIGFNIVEMKHNREESLCCGGGAGLRTNNPELANRIAKKRIKEAKETGVEKIITPCPMCFKHMEENSNIKVIEFSQVLAEALGVSFKEEKNEQGK